MAILNELMTKQLKNIPNDKKMCFNDLKRLSKYIGSSIFDENKCSLWNGYVTNANNASKGVYINFYFRGKKAALHRLIYINFVGPLTDNEYLKFSCENKGKCCNVAHLARFEYLKPNPEPVQNTVTIEPIVNRPPENPFVLSFN